MLVVGTISMYLWLLADSRRRGVSQIQRCSLRLRNFVGIANTLAPSTDAPFEGTHICLETPPHRSFLQSSSHASRRPLQPVKAPRVHPSLPRLFQARIQVWRIFRLIPPILWSVFAFLTTLANRSLLFKKGHQVGEEPLRAQKDRGLHGPFPFPGI